MASVAPGSGDSLCVSGGGIRATLVGLVVLHELQNPKKAIVPTVGGPSAAAAAAAAAVPGQPRPRTDAEELEDDSSSNNSAKRVKPDDGDDDGSGSGASAAAAAVLAGAFPEEDEDVQDLKNYILSLPEMLRKKLRDETGAGAGAGGAGAGAGAGPSGKVWRVDASPPGIKVAEETTFGASGGAWCVLINEVVGAGDALQNAVNFIVGAGEGIGWSFGKEALRVANKWAVLDKYWSPYVEEVIDSMITPFTPATYKVSLQARRERVQKALAAAKGVANVTIGFSPRTLKFWTWTDKVLTVQRDSGWLEGDAGASAIDAGMTIEKVPIKLLAGDVSFEKGPIALDRLLQAGLTSTAYVGVDGSVFSLNIAGLGAGVRLAGEADYIDTCLWDLGLTCNVPVTPQQLRTAGTSLAVDSSFDKALFDSMKACIAWWKKKFQVVVKDVPYAELLKADAPPVVWNGFPLQFGRLDESLRKYIGVYRAPASGRVIVTLEMGRIDANGNVVEDRMRGLETTHLTPKLGETARVFFKGNFDIINREVRRFYRQVLSDLGLPHGEFNIFA